MNAFDLVVTVALGSTLATILLSADVALAEGLLALALLVAAQYVVAWSAVRLRAVRQAVRSRPTLLVWHGRMREQTLQQQRVSRAEVLQAIRSQGLGGLDQVAAVVLETDGGLSVIPTTKVGDHHALDDVPDVP
nr:YetF domain-containing protein [Amycolatopsis arida]